MHIYAVVKSHPENALHMITFKPKTLTYK